MNVMKKIYSFLMLAIISIVAVSSCQKMDGPTPDKNVLVGVSYEEVLNPDMTKVSINEGADAFTLTWNADDVVTIANSANDDYKQNQALVAGANTSNATFSLELPAIDESITQVDYVLSSSSFSSRSYSEEGNYSFLRGAVAASQSANGTNIANSCFIVGINKDCEVGDPGESFSMKTMNSFLKFELTNGDAENYPEMYVSTIKIEAVGGEQIAGRFGIDLTAEDWYSAYGNDTNIKAANKSSFITLDCGNAELTDVAKTFYVAAAFGTYSKGLKVTISVNDGNGKYGEMVKTISNNTSLTLSRNVMYRYPAVAVTPEDVVLDTYTLIDNVEDLTAGTYYMAAKPSDYHIWNGSISSGDLVTTNFIFSDNTLTGDGEMAEVVLVSTGTANQYYIKCNNKYLTTSSIASRKLSLVDTSDGSYFIVSDDSRGGIKMLHSTIDGDSKQVHIVTASAQSNYLRGYAATSSDTRGVRGVYFFKKN